jgi:hypothetical protein
VHDAYFLLCIATKSAHMLPFRAAGADRSFGLERRIQTLIEIAAVHCHDLQHSIGTHAGSGVVVGIVY